MISEHWFKYLFGAIRHQAITQASLAHDLSPNGIIWHQCIELSDLDYTDWDSVGFNIVYEQ